MSTIRVALGGTRTRRYRLALLTFAFTPTGAPPGAAARTLMPNSRQLRVLVVDDHPDSAEASAQLLALHGHDARAVHSCAEALAAISGQTPFVPEVVLLDVRLPDGDAFTLARELCRALPVRPGLIAHTGLPGLEERCRAAAFDHYLLKPADPGVLVDLVAKCAPAP